MIDAALENTASVAMSGDLYAMGGDCVIDELVVLCRQAVEALLNDVVAVKILDECYNVHAQSDDDRMDLPRGGEKVDRLLDSARAMHVERNAHKLRSDRLDDKVALIVGAVFQHLLTQVVAEWIWKEQTKTSVFV